MTSPRDTPNAATTTRPERSSKRVARKKPLAWLPIALLAGLALLALLVFLAINAVDDDGPDGPAGDSLGQVSGSGGSGVNGDDEAAAPSAGAPSGGAPSAPGSGIFSGPLRGALVGGAGIAAAPSGTATAGGPAGGTTPTGGNAAGNAGTVLFAEGSAEIDAEGQRVVDEAARALQAGGATTVEVIGYTDTVAGAPVNEPLSQERATAVATALQEALPAVSVTTSARGQEDPAASNDTEQGRQQNRRAAILARG